MITLYWYSLLCFPEVHCINEKGPYLAELVHDIGLKLKSTAVCTHLHRVRYGHFHLEHSLLRKHWNLQAVLHNMHECKHLLTPQKLFTEVSVNRADELDSQQNLSIEPGEEKGVEELIKSYLQNKHGT